MDKSFKNSSIFAQIVRERNINSGAEYHLWKRVTYLLRVDLEKIVLKWFDYMGESFMNERITCPEKVIHQLSKQNFYSEIIGLFPKTKPYFMNTSFANDPIFRENRSRMRKIVTLEKVIHRW